MENARNSAVTPAGLSPRDSSTKPLDGTDSPRGSKGGEYVDIQYERPRSGDVEAWDPLGHDTKPPH